MSEIDPKDPSLQVSFVIAEDPAFTAAVGEKLIFAQIALQFEIKSRSALMRNWQVFEGAVLALTFSDGHEHRILGSAVMVAPGIAFCANHVMHDHLSDLVNSRVSVMGFGIASHGALGWRVRHILVVDRSDLCLLSLEYAGQLPPDRRFRQMGITTRLPAEGEDLVVAGFRPSRKSFPAMPGQRVEFSGNVVLCSGRVTQRFPIGRDSSLVYWPALEIDCPAWGGMSGGPVFDSRGWLVGLVSRSLETQDEPSPMTAALLWPALGHAVSAGWPLSPSLQYKSLLELAGTTCSIERPSAVTAIKDPQSSRVETTYEAWT